MTDKLHYPDLFKTINIPENRQTLALDTQNLFDIVHGQIEWYPAVFENLKKSIDTRGISQLYWEFERLRERKNLESENADRRIRDTLAITAMPGYFAIGFEHFDLSTRTTNKRKSLMNFRPETIDLGGISIDRLKEYPEEEITPDSFVKDFYDISIANLGLSDYIRRLHESRSDQNESSSAIFANAA
jgi:hypothetical protein